MFRIISVNSRESWRDALLLCGDSDVYHSAEYHYAAQELGEGKAFLFLYEDLGAAAVLPFLVRPIPYQQPDLLDATTVYGYPGALCSIKKDQPGAMQFKRGFQAGLKAAFSSLEIVSFFARTNPIFPTNWLFQGMANIESHGETVFIDLSSDEKVQLSEITKGHKYDIRKARKLGVEIEEDKNFRQLEKFIYIYEETMDRTKATTNYFFPKNYYETMKASLKDKLRLFHAKYEGQIIASSMFLFHEKIIQYHLSGSLNNTLKFNGVKLILDEIRKIGSIGNFSFLHLGGGVASAKDNLFKFKSGFSKSRLSFETVRMVVDKKTYARLAEPFCQEMTDFFPIYRNNELLQMPPESLNLTTLEQLIRKVFSNNNRSMSASIGIESHLVNDLGMDSLDLAELTVLIEDKTGIDIFENRTIMTIQDVLDEASN